MNMDAISIVLVFIALLPYGYILVNVLSSAFFAAKLNYHKQIIKDLDSATASNLERE